MHLNTRNIFFVKYRPEKSLRPWSRSIIILLYIIISSKYKIGFPLFRVNSTLYILYTRHSHVMAIWRCLWIFLSLLRSCWINTSTRMWYRLFYLKLGTCNFYDQFGTVYRQYIMSLFVQRHVVTKLLEQHPHQTTVRCRNRNLHNRTYLSVSHQ